MGLDYYAILDVTRNANNNEIAQAYRKLAIRLHPDKIQKGKESKNLSLGKSMKIIKKLEGSCFRARLNKQNVLTNPSLIRPKPCPRRYLSSRRQRSISTYS